MRLRRRWIVGLVVAPIAVVAIAYGYLAWSTKDAPPHAALQPRDTASGAGRVDPDSIVGRWTIVEGSGFVGYRIRERLGPVTAPSDAVGRSTAVTGTAVLEATRLTRVDLSVDMTALASDVGSRDMRLQTSGLETTKFPASTFVLTTPVELGQTTKGEVIDISLHGDLTLHGQKKPIDVPVQARWDGPTIEVAGSARVALSDFGISLDGLPGFKIDSTGSLEFELTLAADGSSLDSPPSTISSNPQTPTGEPTDPPCPSSGQPVQLPSALLFTIYTDAGVEVWIAGPGPLPAHSIAVDAMDAAWSPDAAKVVYVTSPRGSGAPQLVIANADGTAPNVLRQFGAAEPDWSPDGTSIVFTKASPGGDTTEIWRVGIDGTGAHRLAGDSHTSVGQPRWTPDGTQIIYTQGSTTTNDDVWIMNADGTSPTSLFGSAAYDYSGSIQGGHLLHVVDGRLHIATPGDTSSDKPTSPGPNDGDPALTSDGATLAFVHQGNIYVGDVNAPEKPCLPIGVNVLEGLRWSPVQ